MTNDRVGALIADEGFREDLEALRIRSLRGQTGAQDEGLSLPRLQRNLVALNRVVRSNALEEDTSVDAIALALTLAQAFERLAETGSPDPAATRLAAAVNYELAGYQANAATMARVAADVSFLSATEDANFNQLVSLFLQRRFLRLSISRDSPPPEPAEVTAAHLIEAARFVTQSGLAEASRYFLTGATGTLDAARRDLTIALEVLSDLGAAAQANAVSGIRSLLPQLQAKSTWSQLSPFLPGNRLWERYLRALGRGLGGNRPLDARSISELWPSQQAAIQAGILDSHSRVVRMPTSAGKTRIAEMCIIHALASRPGARALYVGPFNALTNEVVDGFNDLFVDLGLSLSSLTGSYESSPVDAESLDDDLLVLTPEKLDLLLRSESEFVDELDVVVLDESHIVGEENRGPKYEIVISRLRQRRPDVKIVALSAVVPDSTLDDFTEWLQAPREAVSTDWRPTTVQLARLSWRKGRGDLIFEAGAAEQPTVVEGFVKTETLTHVNPVTGRTRNPRFPDTDHRAQVAAASAWESVSQGGVLIYCATPDFAESVAGALIDRMDYAALRDESLPAGLDDFSPPPSARVAEEWLGADHKVTRQLRRGVGVHFAPLPAAVKQAVEDDFRGRRLRVLAATPTLAQGVNLPLRTLIVHTTRRYDEAEGRQIRLTARDFWNIAGRVGRAGTETQGTVIFLSFNTTDDDDFDYFRTSQADVEPVTSALMRMLVDLVERRISSADVARKLDPEMLALVVEEGEQVQTPEGVKAALGSTLFQVQSAAAGRQSEPLWRLMASTAAAASQRVPDLENRRVFAATGLSTDSCLSIARHTLDNAAALRDAFSGLVPAFEISPLLLEGLASCDEMSPRWATDVSHQTLLLDWMEGLSVSTIAVRYQMDALRLTRFVEDFFGYRLPWGVSAYLRIARHLLSESEPADIDATSLLIKYGVPSTTASWVMALGVRSRPLAVTLAEQYERTHEARSARTLRHWLGSLEVEEMVDYLGISADLLPEVREVALKANGNVILQGYYRGDAELLPQSVVVTVRSASPVDAVSSVAEGSELEVQRDYEGAYRNSLVVWSRGRFVCRLPRVICDALAISVDGDERLSAVVTGIDDLAGNRRRLELLLSARP